MVSRAAALSLFLIGSADAAELEGVRLEDRIQVDGQALQLNGVALRTRYLFKVYVAGLYLQEKASSAQAVFDAKGAKRIVLVMMRDATADQFCESVEVGLRANHTDEELARVNVQTDALMAMIRAAAEARKGSTIVLDYAPSAGATTLFIDGVAQGPPMPGEEFYRALLRIWLGERPAQENLKRLLLGLSENEGG